VNKKISYTLLITSIIFFALGLYYPIITTKHQIIGFTLDYQEIRLIDSVIMFYESSDFLLASIIFIFTIILPIIKYLELFFRIKSQKKSTFLSELDKWSMIDVFLVALLLLNFKMDSNIIVMQLKLGTQFIAISVILRMITSSIIEVKQVNTIKNKSIII
jgi:paraquat-inducible protein A